MEHRVRIAGNKFKYESLSMSELQRSIKNFINTEGKATSEINQSHVLFSDMIYMIIFHPTQKAFVKEIKYMY